MPTFKPSSGLGQSRQAISRCSTSYSGSTESIGAAEAALRSNRFALVLRMLAFFAITSCFCFSGTAETLAWDVREGAASYKVSINGGTPQSTTATSLKLGTLVPGSYKFSVVAVNSAGQSAIPAIISWTKPQPTRGKKK